MSMRSSSLANNPLAITRELDGRYDVVLQVRDNLDLIEQVAGVDFEAIIAELEAAQDFTGITVVQGETVAWDAVNKILTVPKGDKGDKGNTGLTGPQGLQGDTGSQGIKGDKGDKGDTGSQGPKGFDGEDGVQGPKGDTGADLTITQITYNGNGTFNWLFSDGTTYVTPDLRGPKGDVGNQGVKGDQGISVHHIKGTSTTDSEGDFGSFGEIDTYTVYGDAAETINLGYFRVNNGATKEGQYSIMYGSTYDTNSNGVVDNSERLEGKTLYEVQDFSNIHGKPTTLSGYGISDAFTKAEVTNNISNAIAGLVNGSPAVLDTLGELSAALANDANFATTIANSIGDKVTKNTAIVSGTNTQITYDSKGLITGGTTPTTLAGYSINDAYTKIEGDNRYESKNANIQSHIASTSNPHGVTKTQVGLGNVDNTADSTKNVLSATKWTTARTLSLTGDVTGSSSIDGSANVTITTTVQPNSVALGTDTTGNYVAGVTAGTGIAITGTAGEGWSPTVALSTVGTTGTYRSVTTDTYGRVTAGTNPTTVAGYGLTDVYTKTEIDIELALKAAIASPTFTGVPKAPTASVGTNTTQLATTAYVVAEINKIEEW